MDLHDLALLQKYPELIPTTEGPPESRFVGESKPQKSTVGDTRKKRRFIAKGTVQNATLAAEKRVKILQSQKEAGTPFDVRSKVAEPAFGLLYHTLVADGAIPMGLLQDFLKLEAPARRAAKRQPATAVSISDSVAEARLRSLRREADQRASSATAITDQIMIAADLKPRKICTKWQQAVYEGPTARKDAESAERDAGLLYSLIC